MNDLILIKSETFGSVQCDFYSKNTDVLMTRKQIGEALEYADPQKAIDNLHAKHKDRLDKFSVTLEVRGTDGKAYSTCLYTAKGIYEICRWSQQSKADTFYDFVYETLESLRKTGSYSIQQPAIKPITPTEALLQAVQILATQEKQIKALEEKITVAHHRIDSLDATNITGTPQQRLNAMIRKYAYDNGIFYGKGWDEFKSSFNTAYHTNLEARRLNYVAHHNLKRLSLPQYLTNSGLIEDALRVASKMLDRQEVV